ncbi:hypothetical protein Y032_0048g1634 [Ancylostoma ceylanicum]|uniref:Uncharacterized protein n=1 Tax=Ancylostoma ceylanicum TaxID=53326 RepID=A0A016UBE3_9BILA|nr:hypothetical protein Y032_0048g1634 [Ancylostoma ceylanicum]
MYSELQTAVDKGRDCGAAFLGKDTGGSACWLWLSAAAYCSKQKQTTRASMRSRCVPSQERRAAIAPLVYGNLEFTVVFPLFDVSNVIFVEFYKCMNVIL